MSRDTLEAVVEWQRALGEEPDGDAAAAPGTLEITFHGGEPLVPGAAWYRISLPLLRDGMAPRRVRFAAQSNLWLLTDELCEFFAEHRVSLGTSLDGPEAINDAQRGSGYFARTMAGIERARAHGLDVGVICTFTRQSVARAPEIFDFFAREGLSFSVHAALPALGDPSADLWSITPEEHGELLVGLLDRYLQPRLDGSKRLYRTRRHLHLRRLPRWLPRGRAGRGDLPVPALRGHRGVSSRRCGRSAHPR
jgi:uncharacterized protein